MFKNLATRLRSHGGFSTCARTRPFQVAIDGPAASGKSTTAKMVAQRLGFDYIDTGAFYRCVTLAALAKGIDPSDPLNASRISEVAEQSRIGLKTVFSKPTDDSTGQILGRATVPTTRVYLNSKDVSSEIRTGNVSKHVSSVAAIGEVRQAVLNKVRSIGATDSEQVVNSILDTESSPKGLVMDGRDIGTVVLPHADLKVFLIADSRVRAERRLLDLAQGGSDPTQEVLDVEAVQRDLERRDELDRTRKVSPLKKAEDAMVLDTSDLTIEGQVDVIVKEFERRCGADQH